MTRSSTAIFMAVICLVYATMATLYIDRTSFDIDGTRYYSLWDDGMISMRYADNLVNGKGLVWNPEGERVQGISNPGVTLLMAAAHLVPVNRYEIPLVFQLMNLAMLLAILFLVRTISLNLFPQQPAIAVISVIGIALCAPLGIWGLQGSDSTVVALWLLVPVAVISGRMRTGGEWPLWLWAWIALGSVIRLDCILYSGVIVLGSTLLPGTKRFQRMMVGGVLSVAVFGAVLLFAYLYYGDALPNTYYLKATGTPKWAMLKGGYWALTQWPGLLLSLVVALYATYEHRKNPLLVMMMALVTLSVVYCVWVGGDWAWINGQRFIVPVLPLLIIILVSGCIISSHLGKISVAMGNRFKKVLPISIALLASVLVNTPSAINEWIDQSTATMYHSENKYNAIIGVYLKEMTDVQTVIGVHWAGISPYYSQRPVVDLLGKSDRFIARMVVPRFFPGHSKRNWDYTFKEQRPDILIDLTVDLGLHPYFQANFLKAVDPQKKLEFYVHKGALHRLKATDLHLYSTRTNQRLSHRQLAEIKKTMAPG